MELEVYALVALILGVVNLLVSIPLVGKTFFATHTREYMPLEDLMRIRQGESPEQPSPVEQAEQKAEEITTQLFGAPPEEYDPLENFNAALQKKKEQVLESQGL